MRNVFIYLTFVLCSTILVSSCSKDGDADILPCSHAWATDLQKEFTAVTDAATVYALDQSAAHCTALKSAYQDYIDALKPYGSCATLTGQNRADWQKALSDAEADVNTICD